MTCEFETERMTPGNGGNRSLRSLSIGLFPGAVAGRGTQKMNPPPLMAAFRPFLPVPTTKHTVPSLTRANRSTAKPTVLLCLLTGNRSVLEADPQTAEGTSAEQERSVCHVA